MVDLHEADVPPLDAVPSWLTFWGKAQPDTGTPSPPLPTLPRITASTWGDVVNALLDSRPRVLARASALLGVGDLAAVRQVLVVLAALHDLGKFGPAFQVKAPDRWPGALGTCDPDRIVPGRHTDDGYALWHGVLARRVTERVWPGGGPVLRVLAAAVFGHHGEPVGGASFGQPSSGSGVGWRRYSRAPMRCSRC